MPTIAPNQITMMLDGTSLTVTWQPLTLVEAKGFIDYIIILEPTDPLYTEVLNATVSWSESSVIFHNIDVSMNYSVTVRASVSGRMQEPSMLASSYLVLC